MLTHPLTGCRSRGAVIRGATGHCTAVYNSWWQGISLLRVESRFAISQWETALLCNDVFLWLGANPMRYGVTLYQRHSLAGRKPCISPDYSVILAWLVTSWPGNAFRITDRVWGESTAKTGPLIISYMTHGFHTQTQWCEALAVFFAASPNKLLSKQSSCECFETEWHWCDCVKVGNIITTIYPLPLWVNSVHDDVIKWKHFPRYWPFVREFHRSPVNSTHKGQWLGALMCSFICVLINGWANNREEIWGAIALILTSM